MKNLQPKAKNLKTPGNVVILNERLSLLKAEVLFRYELFDENKKASNMDQAGQTMIENLKKNSGKSLEEWVEIVQAQNFAKHGEIISFLKKEYNFTHGFANLVAHKAKGSDAGSAADTESLVDKQYAGKEHFKPLYERLVKEVKSWGNDVEIAPKNAYVSLRSKKQFAMLQPASKTRFEIGLNLKGTEARGKLEEIKKTGAMFSHRICLAAGEDADNDVIDWLRQAYQLAK